MPTHSGKYVILSNMEPHSDILIKYVGKGALMNVFVCSRLLLKIYCTLYPMHHFSHTASINAVASLNVIIGVGGMFHRDLVECWKKGNSPTLALKMLQYTYRHEEEKVRILPSSKKIASLFRHLRDKERSKAQVKYIYELLKTNFTYAFEIVSFAS